MAPGLRAGERVDAVIGRALREDLGDGDLTSRAIAAGARARARLVAKRAGIVAGLGVFARTFELCEREAVVELLVADGRQVEPGDCLARVEGCARALLAAERTALNFAQRMSGIATLTRAFVDAVAGAVRILDTRKTTPGLRLFEKYAVRCGGGENHRFGLFDEVMVKDNHTDLAGRPLADVVRGLRAELGPAIRITAEARTLDEALAGLAGGADVLLLDNLAPAELSAVAARLRDEARRAGRSIELEASGGITLETIGAIARTADVDRISIGALTHSAPALDLSLYLEPLR